MLVLDACCSKHERALALLADDGAGADPDAPSFNAVDSWGYTSTAGYEPTGHKKTNQDAFCVLEVSFAKMHALRVESPNIEDSAARTAITTAGFQLRAESVFIWGVRWTWPRGT